MYEYVCVQVCMRGGKYAYVCVHVRGGCICVCGLCIKDVWYVFVRRGVCVCVWVFYSFLSFFKDLFFFPELRTEPRALCFLGKRSTTVLNPQPLFILFIWVHCTCFQTHQKRASDLIYRWLWITMWLLGFELRTSGRSVSALNQWAISPALAITFQHTLSFLLLYI